MTNDGMRFLCGIICFSLAAVATRSLGLFQCDQCNRLASSLLKNLPIVVPNIDEDKSLVTQRPPSHNQVPMMLLRSEVV